MLERTHAWVMCSTFLGCDKKSYFLSRPRQILIQVIWLLKTRSRSVLANMNCRIMIWGSPVTVGVILVAVGITITHVEAAAIVEDLVHDKLSLTDGTFDGYNYFVRYICTYAMLV